MNVEKKFGRGVELLWKDTKRFCGMPITFTKYYLIEKKGQWIKLVQESGMLSTNMEEAQMYRVDDFSVFESMTDKLFGVGNIKVYIDDASGESIDIVNVKNVTWVKELLSECVERDRRNRGVRYNEFQQ